MNTLLTILGLYLIVGGILGMTTLWYFRDNQRFGKIVWWTLVAAIIGPAVIAFRIVSAACNEIIRLVESD